MKPSFFLGSLAIALLTTAMPSNSVNIMPESVNQQNNTLLVHGEHDHKKMEVPKGQPIPSVKLIVTPDAKKGWNLEIKTTNFKFAPEKVNDKSMSTSEGHAHLYINGKKVARLYGNWYYIESLPAGENKIMVSLNTNNHADITVNGKTVADTKMVKGK
jgi:uncharacterized Zn-binding protein involved in type VI secretion